ncbi:caspase-3-like [Dreissena polymorpha]|uniref:caspase-3-like n=1 Tax=Dreissena polymorpha TaxID=45954 RepID=UPI0022652D15|nr:caspase-3-like [Dreissena polymorpha]
MYNNVCLQSESAVERRIAVRQLTIKSNKSASWFVDIRKLFWLYELGDPEDLLESPTEKEHWKRTVNRTIDNIWLQQTLAESKTMKILQNLNMNMVKPRKPHPLLQQQAVSTYDANRQLLKLKFMCGKYILQSDRASFSKNKVDDTCRVCYKSPETLQHMVLECSGLSAVRDPILRDIESEIEKSFPCLWKSIVKTLKKKKKKEMSFDDTGLCIIINIQEFPGTKMQPRVGSEKDRDNLKKTFTWLDFDVKCYDNLSGRAMIRMLEYVAKKIDHTNYDCFVCCILTHGELNHLCGSDGEPIPLKKLTNNFNIDSCPGLAGKPKLFLLQACQDEPLVEGEKLQVDSSKASEVETLPNHSDFLIGYCTAPGHPAYRDSTGSIYIKTLCEQLIKRAHSSDILRILTMVNLEVSKWVDTIENKRVKQMPAPQSMLRKLLFLKPSESKT